MKVPLEARLVVLNTKFSRSNLVGTLHAHPFHEVGIVLNGRCDWRLPGNRRITVEAGEGVLMPPGQRHTERNRDLHPLRLAWIGFCPATGGDIPFLGREYANRCLHFGRNFADIRRLFERIEEESVHRGREGARERISLALTELVILIRRAAQGDSAESSVLAAGPEPRHSKSLAAAAEYLEGNCENTLKINQLARYHSLSHNHFIVLFSEKFGMTPMEYLQECRLKKARQYLSEPGRQIKEIAALCGFKDPARFNRWFKERTGQTPLRCARSLRQIQTHAGGVGMSQRTADF
ncbi:MAG: AraC family transcriptional regulator [Verrucomicrobiae bacterium]|nr:AraC family transcriptional regulator [Verrucomicrobiae bacterium]